jgi:hypothetical protein
LEKLQTSTISLRASFCSKYTHSWLFFANRGEFRDGDLNEIMNKTSCLSLLCNATVVWNTIHMQKIVDQLRKAGQTVRDEDLARIWPLLHEHILPNGIYDFVGC